MRYRNHKSIILICLTVSCLILSGVWISGCSDNPEAKAEKEIRSKTAQAVQISVNDRDYEKAHNEVGSLLQRNPSRGLAKDAALLASGNLALARGQQLHADLGLKTLPLRGGVDQLEKILRDSERLLIEKERIEMLLKIEENEVSELQQLLDGDTQKAGLTAQLDEVNGLMDQLQSQKASVQERKEQIQAILNEHQSNADLLMHEAELASGSKRLQLEKEAISILKKRKQYYIDLQTAENEIATLDSDIALIQVRLDGLNNSIQENKQRVNQIVTSEIRSTLNEQKSDIKENISNNTDRLSTVCGEITAGLNGYRQMTEQICAVYKEAIAEFKEVNNSGDASITATMRLADSAHYAALACSELAKVQKDVSERLRDIIETADTTFVSTMQSKLPAQYSISDADKKEIFEYFDQAVEAYEKASSKAGRLPSEAKSGILKSQLLALHSKMQIADMLGDYDLATSTDTAVTALIEKGNELGVSFTQSEAMRVINSEGLNYMPSIPLNMQVFLEGKKQELSEWKQLPVSEQEPAVEKNIKIIDDLIAQYGQDAASQLEPMKQEMLAAKERGFQEPTSSSGFGEPNSL